MRVKRDVIDESVFIESATCALILSGVIALLTVILIASFKRLRSQAYYRLILHASVITVFICIGLAVCRGLVYAKCEETGVLIVLLFVYAFGIVNLILVSMMGIDFLVNTYFVESAASFRCLRNCLIGLAYVLAIIVTSFVWFLLYIEMHPYVFLVALIGLFGIIFTLCFLTYVGVLIYYFVLRKRQPQLNTKSKVEFVFTLISFVSWLIIILSLNGYIWIDVDLIRNFTGIMFVVTLLYPLLSFIAMYSIDHNFSASFIQFVKFETSKWNEDVNEHYGSLRYNAKEQDDRTIA